MSDITKKEHDRYMNFQRRHNLQHPKIGGYYYEVHPTGIGSGITAVCPYCLSKRFKCKGAKLDITDYDVW